jgi:hypothetical protein
LKKACRECRHFFMDGEGWELPQFDYPNCAPHPHLANLKSFPFTNTSCPSHELKDR